MHPHAESGGLSPDGDMPECFLAAFVLDHLGDEVTMTIETNSGKVIGWRDGSAGARIVTRRTDREGLEFASPHRSDNV